MKLYEGTVIEADFDRVVTRVNKGGEMDIYRAPNLEGVEIRVCLTPDSKGILSASSIHVTNQDGKPVKIYDEDDKLLDREFTEVLGWRVVEYNDASLDYNTGRLPAVDAEGNKAEIGHVITWVDEQQPVLEPG